MIYIKEAGAKIARRSNIEDCEWIDFIECDTFNSFKAFLEEMKEEYGWDEDVVVLETTDMPDEYSDEVFDKELGINVVEIYDEFFELLNEMDERCYDYGNYEKMDAFSYYCERIKDGWDISYLDEFEDAYKGKYESKEDYCYDKFCDQYNVQSIDFDLFSEYVDFEKMAKDWFDGDLYYEDGFVFGEP